MSFCVCGFGRDAASRRRADALYVRQTFKRRGALCDAPLCGVDIFSDSELFQNDLLNKIAGFYDVNAAVYVFSTHDAVFSSLHELACDVVKFDSVFTADNADCLVGNNDLRVVAFDAFNSASLR